MIVSYAFSIFFRNAVDEFSVLVWVVLIVYKSGHITTPQPQYTYFYILISSFNHPCSSSWSSDKCKRYEPNNLFCVFLKLNRRFLIFWIENTRPQIKQQLQIGLPFFFKMCLPLYFNSFFFTYTAKTYRRCGNSWLGIRLFIIFLILNFYLIFTHITQYLHWFRTYIWFATFLWFLHFNLVFEHAKFDIFQLFFIIFQFLLLTL